MKDGWVRGPVEGSSRGIVLAVFLICFLCGRHEAAGRAGVQTAVSLDMFLL